MLSTLRNRTRTFGSMDGCTSSSHTLHRQLFILTFCTGVFLALLYSLFSFLAFATRRCSSCLTEAHSTTNLLEGSNFLGNLQFLLRMHSHKNHMKVLYIKRRIGADWSYFPLSDRRPFPSRRDLVAEAVREALFLTFT